MNILVPRNAGILENTRIFKIPDGEIVTGVLGGDPFGAEVHCFAGDAAGLSAICTSRGIVMISAADRADMLF